jgi:hypothetical protein
MWPEVVQQGEVTNLKIGVNVMIKTARSPQAITSLLKLMMGLLRESGPVPQ